MNSYIEYSHLFLFFKAINMQSTNASGPIAKFLVTVSLYDICSHERQVPSLLQEPCLF